MGFDLSLSSSTLSVLMKTASSFIENHFLECIQLIFMEYELRRKDKAMPLEDAIAFLESSKVGRLAMALNNQPYVVPINYVYVDGKIYFHCAKEGKKIDYFTKNPNVCFEVDELISIRKGKDACEWGVRYRSVIAYGTIKLLEDEKRKLEVMNRFVEKYAEGCEAPPVSASMLTNVNVAEITVERITGKQDLK